jgi:hypothetical protein
MDRPSTRKAHMEEDPRSKSWWHTLPGILTAAAGAITAIAALVTALHQAGWLGPTPAPATAPPSSIAVPSAPANASPSITAMATASAPVPAAAQPSVVLPERVEMAADTLDYRILNAQLLAQNPGQRSLKFHIRVTNNGRYDGNFWSASFRLLADGSLLAPANELNELVRGNSTMEGWVEFTVPDSLAQAQLQMGTVGAGVAGIPIVLKAGP